MRSFALPTHLIAAVLSRRTRPSYTITKKENSACEALYIHRVNIQYIQILKYKNDL